MHQEDRYDCIALLHRAKTCLVPDRHTVEPRRRHQSTGLCIVKIGTGDILGVSVELNVEFRRSTDAPLQTDDIATIRSRDVAIADASIKLVTQCVGCKSLWIDLDGASLSSCCSIPSNPTTPKFVCAMGAEISTAILSRHAHQPIA